jgi:hypothetical protein
MKRVNLKDIQSKIVSNVDIDIVSHIPIAPRANCKKVNLNSINNLSRAWKKQEIVQTSFDVILDTYDSIEEIEHMKSLLKIKAIRNNRTGKVFDLAEERLFMRLKKIEQVKVVVHILESDIDVVIAGYEEKAIDSNIDQLKKLIAKLEIEHKKKQALVNDNVRRMARSI